MYSSLTYSRYQNIAYSTKRVFEWRSVKADSQPLSQFKWFQIADVFIALSSAS